jgi:hypothetical protein
MAEYPLAQGAGQRAAAGRSKIMPVRNHRPFSNVTGSGRSRKHDKTVAIIFGCPFCGAKDCRDKDHARGCPSLAPTSRERLLDLARQSETAWALKSGRGDPHAAPDRGRAEAAHG